MTRRTVVLFTRDLRLHDQPALAAAVDRSEEVLPIFVHDPLLEAAGFVPPVRARFLEASLQDLDRSLGGGLVRRRGDPAAEAVRAAREVGADAIHVSHDVSLHATRRQDRLGHAAAAAGVRVDVFPGVTIVSPGEVRPNADDHFRVFTPYYRRWRGAAWRRPQPVPMVRLARGVASTVGASPVPAGLPHPGGEAEGRRRLEAFLAKGLPQYRQTPRVDRPSSSGLSPYLHFGCLSPLEVALRAAGGDAGEAFLRQLCWRDFHHQVAFAFPELPRRDYRARPRRWEDGGERLEAWKRGRTGVPIVDAAMRQLAAEGWIHNRLRLLVASYLSKDLGVDWREGAAHFLATLVDGDIANNSGNWQWVAGTGTDTRPNRVFNPYLQARRLDPEGDYVRRWLPELRSIPGLAGAAVHEPHRIGPLLAPAGYPTPLVDHAAAARRFRERAVAS